MTTNNLDDALRSAGNEFTSSTKEGGRIPDFAVLSQRRSKRRLLVGAALAIGLMLPAAAVFLSARDSTPQLAIAEKDEPKKQVVASVIAVSANSNAVQALGLSATEVPNADQGFRPARDGFNFASYDGAQTSDAIDATVMVALFGRSNVCANETGSDCVELPAAVDVKNQLNDAMAAGRCEGFATLSQRFFDGIEQRPNGAKETFAVSQLEVAKQISYWWATQVAPSVASSAKQYRAMAPSGIATALVKGMAEKTGFTLGLYSSTGGHSVSPLAVTKDGANWNVYVYDNNYPKEIRKVVINPSTESWTYGAASQNSTSAGDTWTGTGPGTLDLTPMSARTGPFNVSFGATTGAPRETVYRVLVTQKLKKKGAVAATPLGAILQVGDKSVNTTDFIGAGKEPFNARTFMAGSRGVGVVAYIPVTSGPSGEVRVRPTGDSTSGAFSVSMDRQGLPSLYASSSAPFTMVGQAGPQSDSITIEGVTAPVEIKTSANGVSHTFTLGKGNEFIVEGTTTSASFLVLDNSGKVLEEGAIPIDIPKGTVINVDHSFDPKTQEWSTITTKSAASKINDFFVENLSLSVHKPGVHTHPVITTIPATEGIQLPLRAIANFTTTTTVAPTTTTTVAPTTTTVAPTTTTTVPPVAVSVSVAGTRSYGSVDSSIIWAWTCNGSVDGCTWAKAQFDDNKLNIQVSATKTSAASATPYSGTMTLVDGVTAPSTIRLSTSVALTIEPRALTVTADDQTKTYGNQDPALTPTTVGLVDGDILVGGLSRAEGENVGNFDITQGTVTDANNPNYKINFTNGTLTINQLALTVTPNSGQTKVYGAINKTLDYSAAALVGSDQLAGNLSYTDAFGNQTITQGTLAAGPNYAVTFTADVTVNVAKKAVTVTPNSGQTKTYGDVDKSITYTTVGLVGSDVLSGDLSYSDEFGNQTITIGTLTASTNYAVTLTADVTVNVTAKALTVTPDAEQTKVYGDTDKTLSYVATDLVVGDALTGDLSYSDAFGNQTITQGTLAAGPNYAVTFTADVTVNVTAKALTVTPDSAQTKVYGATDKTLTYETDGLVVGDPLTVDLSYTDAFGNQTITASTLDAGDNYVVTLTAGVTVDVTAKALEVTPDAGQIKTYGDTDKSITYEIFGLVDGDHWSGDLSYFDAFGEQDITIGTFAAGTNYEVNFTAGVTVDVTAKALEVTPDAGQTKTYGDTDKTITYTTLGHIVGDPLTVDLSYTDAFGNQTITASALEAGDNYVVTLTAGVTVNVTAKALTVTPDAEQTKVYGDTDKTLSYSAADLVGSDALTGNLSYTDAFGNQTITQGTLAANTNYAVTFTSGVTVNVTAKALTVTPDAEQTKVYGDTDKTLSYVATDLVGSDALTGKLSYTDTFGNQTITQGTLAANTNYAVTFTSGVTVNVTAKALTVTPNSGQSKIYGATNKTLGYSAVDLVGSDALTGALSYTDAFGNQTIMQGTLAASTNYAVTFTADVTVNVTAKALTVTPVSGQTKVYGATNKTLTYETIGLVGSDALTGNLSYTDAFGNQTITQGTFAAGTNYVVNFTSGMTVNVTAKALTVTPVSGQTKVYGATNKTLGYSAADLVGSDALTGALSYTDAFGNQTITQGTLAANTNYAVTFTSGVTVNVTAKALTVTPNSGQTKVYGATDKTLGYSAVDLVGSDALTGALSYIDAFGNQTITQGTLAANTNYAVTFTSGVTVNVTAKALTVTADNLTKLSTTAVDPALTYVATGFAYSDTKLTVLTGGLVRANNTNNAVGVYAIGQGTLASNTSNYTISFTPGTLTIEAGTSLSVAVTADNGSQTGSGLSWKGSVGSKLTVIPSGGGTGALTWSLNSGSCTIGEVGSVVDPTKKKLSTSGASICVVKIARAADSNYLASNILVTFTWSNN